jgi:3',5'-cyclic AMP phosphodiesterase CpdA
MAQPAGSPPEQPAPWALALLPDTQFYSQRWPQHFDAECGWLAKHAKDLSLKYVIGLGDITNNNVPEQWVAAQHALGLLDGAVPLALVPGNHDYVGNGGCLRRESLLDQYFSVDKFKASPTFGGLYDQASLLNSYHLFHANRQDWLILCLEFGPRDEVVAWANSVLDKYPQRNAVLVTHAYLTNEGRRLGDKEKKVGHDPHSYPISSQAGGVNDGEELWQKVIRQHANVVFVFCGHVSGKSRLTSRDDAGNDVHQMLVDYQSDTEGGQGFIRLLSFAADGKSVDATSYSASLDRHRRDDANQFTLDLTKTFARPR